MPKQPTKKLTTEKLFEITASGFEGVHEELGELRHQIGGVMDEIQDVKKTSHQILAAVSALTEHEAEETRKRLDRLERHVGIRK